MDTQKYYVKSRIWNGGENYLTVDKNVITDSFWNRWINPKTPEAPQQQFTKRELSKILDGALFKLELRGFRNDADYGEGWVMKISWDEGQTYWEWTNPLIELKCVEE